MQVSTNKNIFEKLNKSQNSPNVPWVWSWEPDTELKEQSKTETAQPAGFFKGPLTA